MAPASDLQIAAAVGQLRSRVDEMSGQFTTLDLKLEDLSTQLTALRRSNAEQHETVVGYLMNSPAKTAKTPVGQAINIGKYTAIVSGVIGLAAQVASIWRPDMAGPLEQLLKLFGG